MHEKNYSTALTLYERVLAQDPNNSEALYGASKRRRGQLRIKFCDAGEAMCSPRLSVRPNRADLFAGPRNKVAKSETLREEVWENTLLTSVAKI